MTGTETPPKDGAIGLEALEDRLNADMAWLNLPPAPWLPPMAHAEGPVLDIAIVGAGMGGLAVAGALRLLGLEATLFDKAPLNFEGPWATTALMETLRSPKQISGPALDLPALTFAAWYQAQFGFAAWSALEKIPRLQWADYLGWYRRVLGLQVRSDHEVKAVRPRADNVVELTVVHAGPSLLGNLFRYLRSSASSGPTFPRIRHASSGGDMVPPEILESLKRIFPSAEVFVIPGCVAAQKRFDLFSCCHTVLHRLGVAPN